jgi:hypothetical protein
MMMVDDIAGAQDTVAGHRVADGGDKKYLGLVWLPSFGAGIKEFICDSRITCLAATELVTEFISNSMIFIPCIILIPLCYPVISVALPNELISSCHFISFIPNEMK